MYFWDNGSIRFRGKFEHSQRIGIWRSFDKSKDKSVLFDLIREIGVSYEAPFLVATLQQFARGIIQLKSNQLDSGKSIPIDVTEDTLRFRSAGDSFQPK